MPITAGSMSEQAPSRLRFSMWKAARRRAWSSALTACASAIHEAREQIYDDVLAEAGLKRGDVAYARQRAKARHCISILAISIP